LQTITEAHSPTFFDGEVRNYSGARQSAAPVSVNDQYDLYQQALGEVKLKGAMSKTNKATESKGPNMSDFKKGVHRDFRGLVTRHGRRGSEPMAGAIGGLSPHSPTVRCLQSNRILNKGKNAANLRNQAKNQRERVVAVISSPAREQRAAKPRKQSLPMPDHGAKDDEGPHHYSVMHAILRESAEIQAGAKASRTADEEAGASRTHIS